MPKMHILIHGQSVCLFMDELMETKIRGVARIQQLTQTPLRDRSTLIHLSGKTTCCWAQQVRQVVFDNVSGRDMLE